MELLLIQKDHTYSRIPPRSSEHDSRPRISGICRQEQLDAAPKHHNSDRETLGGNEHRSICRSIDSQKTQICQLEARSGGNSAGCIQHSVEHMETICFPAILPHRPLPGKDQTRSNGPNHHNASMADTTLVSLTFGNVNCTTNYITARPEFTHFPTGTTPSTSSGRGSETGGMEGLRDRLKAEGFSEGSASLLLESRRPGTQLAYRGPWNKWCCWCLTKQIDPVHAPVDYIANFLTEQVERGLEYSTINGYRSALSAYHAEINGLKVGQLSRIKTLLRGVFNRKPPQPRYNETWDVNQVLEELKTWPDNINLSLKDLTLKLVMLMALVTAARCSELHKLNPCVMVDKGEVIEFPIIGLTKTARPNKPNMSITLHTYTTDNKLDVNSCLRLYMQRTEHLRINKDQKSRLLISYIKPHKSITPSSIARWLKTVMAKAKINTDIFKAHSTRAATSSKANSQGVSAGQIIKCVNWANANTFYKFYNKTITPTEKKQFQNVVLNL